jgi:hypothetical protein
MAPPSEESTLKFPIEKIPAAAESFYENFVSTIEGKAEIAIKSEEVHRVLVLIETIFEAGATKSVIRRTI